MIKHLDKNAITLEQLRKGGLKGNIKGARKLMDKNNKAHDGAKIILKHTESNEQEGFSWEKFEKVAFINNEFHLSFNKSKTHNKTYYDLSWNNGDVHLVIRNNSLSKRLEIYINDSLSLFEYFKKDMKELEKNLNTGLLIDNNAVEKNYVHRKFILNYTESIDVPFIDWVINNAVKLKKNVMVLYNKYNVFFKETILLEYLEDHKLNDSIQDDLNKTDKHFDYKGSPVDKPVPCVNEKGITFYKRDKQKALNALNHASYKCEYDKSHLLFERKKSNITYTEAHHLIPMSFQDKFDKSLDVEENIISLCSNCHNEIHYGKHADQLIKKLYKERKKYLTKVELNVDLEMLLSFYGF